MARVLHALPTHVASGFRPAVRFMRSSAAEAQRTRLPQMAAALSYRTIFGLIPVIVVGLVVLRAFVLKTDDQIANAVDQAMQYTGLSSIAIEPAQGPVEMMGPFPEGKEPAVSPSSTAALTTRSPDGAGVAGGSGATGTAIASSSGEAVGGHHRGSRPARLDQWIARLVTRVSKIDFGAIGVIGAGALLYAALSMLVEIERCFNQVFRVPVGRSWARRVTQYWTLLTLGTFGLVATFYVGQQLSSWLTARFVETSGELLSTAKKAGASLRFDLIGAATSFPITTLLFVLLYTVVPNTRVRLKPALGGAALGAVLFEVGKVGFAQYVKLSTGYAQLYGSIALIPLFMVWIYLMWCIVLFGLNVTYFLQYGRYKANAKALELSPAFVDPSSIVSVMTRAAADFDLGKPVTVGAIAGELRLPEGLVGSMVDRLAGAGFVHRVAAKEGEKAAHYVVARPAEKIEASEVLRLGEELADPGAVGTMATNGVAQTLRAARMEAVRGKTIADFLPNRGAAMGIAGKDAKTGSGAAVPVGNAALPSRS